MIIDYSGFYYPKKKTSNSANANMEVIQPLRKWLVILLAMFSIGLLEIYSSWFTIYFPWLINMQNSRSLSPEHRLWAGNGCSSSSRSGSDRAGQLAATTSQLFSPRKMFCFHPDLSNLSLAWPGGARPGRCWSPCSLLTSPVSDISPLLQCCSTANLICRLHYWDKTQYILLGDPWLEAVEKYKQEKSQ